LSDYTFSDGVDTVYYHIQKNMKFLFRQLLLLPLSCRINWMSKALTKHQAAWDGRRVQALRQHLGLTQREMSERLGTRQQTISEWETGMYRPRGASAKLLSIIAEQARFKYDASPPRQRP
jgi:DNA-binding transcriptional regulator YiaG